jgi:hypothetical protein
MIEIRESEPDFDSLPQVEASIYTPRNVVFKSGGISYIDYQGRAMGIHDKKTINFSILSRDSDLLYESVYLFLRSQVRAFLDWQHMHRVHALAVSICGHAIVVLLPSDDGQLYRGNRPLSWVGVYTFVFSLGDPDQVWPGIIEDT